ncbi:aspartate aminotransferase [Desulfonauticus submarinus]|uniref:Aminotransferase n=1 Tax=Desulfonauticus submarinus TaxID=206665 RepID=A0A1H0D4K7_9BACT|nr:pyridoxal phosphate-dependent aminotransferase [Desulfonauticus submarinus]SDN65029.1 aspartate aminotransferase [Desulfonauticus submarinus]
MLLNTQVKTYLQRSSWIRKMFEKGAELKKEFGADKVFDFSLGNPDLPPPSSIINEFVKLKELSSKPLALGYMPNAGLPQLREKLALFLSKEQGVSISREEVIITCGAAGGINALFRAILEPKDEVVAFAPFFVEYGFYAENHNGILKVVKTKEPDFSLDLGALDQAIGEKTRAIILNSPNNPSGQVYSEQEIKEIADLLRKKSQKFGKPIFLVADEPYRFLVYDGVEVPSILKFYEFSVVVSSFSKSLGLAGERVGYVLVNPDMPNKQELLAGLVLTNRILGFVNAPIIGQYLLLAGLGSLVDISVYQKRRQLMGQILEQAGLEFTWPKGGFYFFPKAPNKQEDDFITALLKENVLAVPGKGFGFPGYVRFAFCVPEETIKRSAEAIGKAVQNILEKY